MAEEPLRRTGFDVVGSLPWGAHICLFYETPCDLLVSCAEYFKAGLEDDEFCVWALSGPATLDNAREALRETVKNFDARLAGGQMELVQGYDWYLQGDEFDSQRITAGWRAKLAEALKRGFAGMRVSGNAFWFQTNLWKEFSQYEAELDQSLADSKMIVLCTYALGASRAVDVLDIARAHNFTIARRHGRWEFLETPELKHAKKEITKLNDAIDMLSIEFSDGVKLTFRERVTLVEIIRGASAKEAARTLGVSPRTIEFHRANIMRKFAARNVAELMARIFRS